MVEEIFVAVGLSLNTMLWKGCGFILDSFVDVDVALLQIQCIAKLPFANLMSFLSKHSYRLP